MQIKIFKTSNYAKRLFESITIELDGLSWFLFLLLWTCGLISLYVCECFHACLHMFSGGTASYLLGMSSRVAAQADAGNTPMNVRKLELGWMYAFLFVVSFVGLFSIVPLRKVQNLFLLDFYLR